VEVADSASELQEEEAEVVDSASNSLLTTDVRER